MNEDFLKELYNSFEISKKNIGFDEFSKDMAKPDFQKLFYDSKKFSDKGISFDEFKSDITKAKQPMSFSIEGTRDAMAKVDEAIKNVKVPTKPVSETVKEQKGTNLTGISTDINWEQGTVNNVVDPEKARIEAAKVAAEKSKSTGEIIPGWKRTVDFTTGQVTDVIDEERRSAYLKTQEEIKKAKEARTQQLPGSAYIPGAAFSPYIPVEVEPDLPVYNLQKAMKPYEEAVAEANGGFFENLGRSIKSTFYAGLDASGGSIPFGGNLYNQYQTELAADRKQKLQKAEELKNGILAQLPEELAKPLDYDSIYQYEASTSTNKEEAVNKTNFKIKEHSNRLRLIEDYNYKQLSPEQQKVADLIKSGQDVDVSSVEKTPEFEKWMMSADNTSKQKQLLKDNVDKYTGVQQYLGNILGELKNKNYDDDVIESSLLNSLETLRQQKPEWSDEIDDAQNFIKDYSITEGDAASAVASWGFNTTNRVKDTIGAAFKGFKSGFYVESTRNLTRGDVDQVVRDEFGRDLRDLLVGASSKYTAPISSNVVEKGNLKLIVEDGKVVDIRRKDDSKIFFPTKYELQVAESYDPKADGEGKVDYNLKSIFNTTGQVISDMLPMVAASMASGGATLPTMLGSMSTMYGSYYNEALQKTGDMKQASLYAAVTSPLIGYVESKIGNLEAKLGRTLSGAEKGVIQRLTLEVGEDVASRGIRNYAEGRGVLTYLKDKVARTPELLGDVKGELLEEFSNFGTEAITAAVTGVEGEPLTMAEVEETAIITTLVSGIMGGGRIMIDNAKEINEMLGYAALNQDKFEEIGTKWVESGRTEEEKEKRRKDFEAKRTSVTEVKDTLNYVNENNFSEKDKDELFNLSLEKAKLLYKMASSESEKTKTNLAKSIADIDKRMAEYTPQEGGPAPEAAPTPEAGIEDSKKGFVTEDEFNTLQQNGRIPSDITFDQFKELPLNKQQEYRQPKPTLTEAQQTELDKVDKRAAIIQQRLDEDKALEDAGDEPIFSKEERQRLETQLQTLNQQRDAIQKQSTTEVPVQPEPQTGEGVGGQVQAEPQVPTGEGQVTEQGQVEEQAKGETVDKEFDESPDTKSFVGSYVDYQGVRGVLLEDGQGNIIVDTGEGDVLVEGALSDMTNKDLGLSRAKRPEINEQDIQKIEQDVTANIDPTVIQTDFGTGRVFYGGKEFKYESTNLDKDGNAVSISMTDADGNKKTIRNKQAVEEIELQKMIFEDLLNNNKITLDNEFAKQFQAQATDLGIKPTITAPQRVQRRTEPVQQGRPAEGVEGTQAEPEVVKRTPGEIKGFEVKKKDGTTIPASNYVKDPKTGKWKRVDEKGKSTPVNTQQMIQQLDAEEKRLVREEQKAIKEQEAKARAAAGPVEIKNFEAKRKDGKTIAPSNYRKSPTSGKWFKVNEQGKSSPVNSETITQQLDAEEKRLAQEEKQAAQQKAKPAPAPAVTVKAPAIEVTPQPEAKGEGVEKTAQKAETKPETAPTKAAPETKTTEPAPATTAPKVEAEAAPPKPEGKVGANGIPQIFFSMPGVKAVGFNILGKFYNVVTNSKRPKIMVDINGTIIPFYMTTGLGGKNIPGGWYPIWGFGEDGWFNKTEDAEIIEFYAKYIGKENAALLKSISEELNNFYGTDPFALSNDYDKDSNLPVDEAEWEFEREVNNLVNSKLPIKPVPLWSGDIVTLTKNIKTIGNNLSKSVEGIKKQQQEEKARQEAQRKAEEQKRAEEQRKAEEQKRAEAKKKAEEEKPTPKKEEPAVEEEIDIEAPVTEEEKAASKEALKMAEAKLAEALLKGFKDGFNISNKAQVAAVESISAGKETKDTILAAKRLIRVLKSVFPNMDIYLHTDPEAYNQRMEELGGVPESGGNFFYAKNADGKVTRGQIDINLSRANPVTVAHEVSHAILLKTFGDNPVLFKKFRDNIEKVLLDKSNENLKIRDRNGESVSWADALSSFEARYAGEEVAPEEYLVQLAAFLSESGNALTIARKAPATLEKIVRAINNLISKATNGKFSPFKNFKASDQTELEKLVDFFNSIGKTLSTGEEITTEQIKAAATLNDLLYPQVETRVSKASVFVPDPDAPGRVENVDEDALEIMNSYEFLNKALDLDKKNTVDINVDVNELNSRLDTPLKKVKWSDFKGMPFIFTISDQLTTGDAVNPITNKTITNLKGGLGFNGTKGNTNSAWANIGDKEAKSTISKAVTIYKNNKELFQKLWKNGSLPNGHVPMAVVKMSPGAILSNEAVFRAGTENVKSLPKENREKALTLLKETISQNINTLKEDIARGASKEENNKKPKVYSDKTITAKKKNISAYTKILKEIDKNKYTDILDIMQDISKFSLPQRKLIGDEIFFGSKPTDPGKKPVKPGKPDTPVSLALIGDSPTALIHIGAITDIITEKAIKDVPPNHIISVVGVDVLNPEITNTTHPNYAKGVKGMSIGVLDKPVHMLDAFGEVYGNAMALAAKKEAEKSSTSTNSLISEASPVQAGLSNTVFKGAVATNNVDAIDKLNGFLRQAFPTTSFFTTQEAWDAVMENGTIDKKSVDGDVLYGFTANGNVYINPDIKTAKAPLHEVGHLWVNFVKDTNPGLYDKGLKLTEGTTELATEMEKYGDTNLAREEALVKLMSTKGETIVNAAQKAKFKEWLLSLWKYVQDNFKSLLNTPADQIENVTLDQFLNGMLADVLGGKELVPPKKPKKAKKSGEITVSKASKVPALQDVDSTTKALEGVDEKEKEKLETLSGIKYHGTPDKNARELIKSKEISNEKFGTQGAKLRSEKGLLGRGLYLTDSKIVAKQFGKVLKIKLKNKLFNAADFEKTRSTIKDWYYDYINKKRLRNNAQPISKEKTDEYIDSFNNPYDEEYVTALNDYAKENGYFGIKHDNDITVIWDKNIIEDIQEDINSDETISQAYHKAKKDGSNPELVKSVEDLLAPDEVTVSKASKTQKRKFDPRDRGQMPEDEFLSIKQALIEMISTNYRDALGEGKKFTEEDFKKILDKFNLSMDDSGIELLFKRAVRFNSYPRTIKRIILTPSIPDNVKDALLDNTKPKEPITDEQIEVLADEIVAPGKNAETNEEAVEIFDSLQRDLIDSLSVKLANIRDGALDQNTYEIRALKKIAQSLIEMGDVERSADVLAKITSLGSLFGKELREIGLNRMDAVYIVHLSRESDANRQEVLDAPAKGYEKTSNRERIDSQNKAAEEALKEGVNERKEATAKKVQERYDKRTSTEKVKAASEEKETKHATEKKQGFFDKIVGSVKDFFGISKSSLNKKNPLADTAGKTIPAAQLAQVAKDYFMYAFYNNNGNTQKAREEFLSKKELKGAHKDIDQIIGSLVSDGTLDKATRELAQAKVLEALQEVKDTSNVRKLSPAQLIAMRIKAIDKRNEKVKPKRKTLEQKIAENDVDIETLTELRNAINAELMQLPANKKEEVLARVDDILVNLRAERLKNRATPWITKAKIREDFKRGLTDLGETVKDLMDDLSKIDVYTNSIAQEFIQRTGMTAEEAAPFVKIIEDEIKSIVDTKVKAALEKEYLDSLQGNRDDLVNAAEEYAQMASDFEAEAEKLRNKTKTPEEVERLKTAQREAARYKKLAARVKSRLKTFDEKAAKRLKSGDFYQILKTITQGGLTQETVVNALANSLRVEVISKEQLNHIDLLTEKIRNATMAKNSVDEEKAINELKKYLYGISNVSFLDIFKRMWESFMYGNMLSSPRTAEVAFFSGTIGLIRDVIANFFQALALDILNFSPFTIGKDGVKTRQVKPDFRNLRTLGNALLDIVGSNKIFSFSTFFEVLKGAEGISIQQMDVSGKTKDRLSNSLAEIDKADVAIDRIKQDPNWKIKPNKIAAVGALEAFKLQQRIARALVAMDYAARSAAIPYAIRMTTAQIAVESLPISATYKDIYNKTNEIINRGEAKAIADAKAAEMEALGKNFDKKRYEKKVATSEAVLPAEVQRRVKEYADRLAWTGRIFGYSGWMANGLNREFEKWNGEPILPSDSLPTTLKKLGKQIPITAFKMVAIPFPGVLFRGMQSVKNATILGLFQRKVLKGPDGKYTEGKGFPLQFFKEHRLYNSAGNVDEVIKASNWEVASRIAWSTIPSVMAWALFQAMFTFDFEDDEEEKEYNESGYFSPKRFGAFFENGGNFKLKSDTDWLITGEYDSDMEAVFRGKGLQYFPNAIYYKGKKLPIVGGYKDMPWGIFFSGLAAIQERELYAEKVKGSGDATRDPLTTSDVFKIMALSGVGFLSEFGLTGALEQLSTITTLATGETDNKFWESVKKAGKNLARTNIPAVGFATWSANLRGMYKDDDKRKGVDTWSGAMANAYVFDDFIDTYDFDALGKRIPYQESPYPILGSVERAVASIGNSNYSLLTNATFKDRQTKADIIRSKYSDFATLIRKQSPKDVLKSERTIVETFDDQSNYDMTLAAATSKGEMLDTYYEYLDGLDRKDFSLRLKEVNNIGNDHAFCSKIISILENNADELMKQTGLSVADIVQKIGTKPKSGFGLTNVQDKNSKGEYKFDSKGNPVMAPGYFKRSKLVDLLYNYDMKITSDGQIKFNQDYGSDYNDEIHEEYMNSQAGDVETE